MERRDALLSIGALTIIPASDLFSEEKAQAPSAELKGSAKSGERAFVMAVTDPLSDRLSCDCVKGYAQRKYGQLAELLSATLECQVQLIYGDTIASIREKAKQVPDLIIGRCSVVKFDAEHHQIPLTPLAMLTDQDGRTTQSGLLVVRSSDPAQNAKDLSGYTIFFGPEECEEKSAASVDYLKSVGIGVPSKLESRPTCTKAVAAVVDSKPQDKVAAVISSYNQPLLVGCGTVQRDAVRIVGQTAPVPFIGAFATPDLTGEKLEIVRETLLAVAEDTELCRDLESKKGFVEVAANLPVAKKN